DDQGTTPPSVRTRPDPRSSVVPPILSDAAPAGASVHVRNPTLTLAWRDGVSGFRTSLRASVGSTEVASDRSASVSSDRSAHDRGCRLNLPLTMNIHIDIKIFALRS